MCNNKATILRVDAIVAQCFYSWLKVTSNLYSAEIYRYNITKYEHDYIVCQAFLKTIGEKHTGNVMMHIFHSFMQKFSDQTCNLLNVC